MTINEKALSYHKQWNGKIQTVPTCSLSSMEDLALAYTPGVAEPCRQIAANPSDVYSYTIKSNTIAVVSDGSAVLGLGNIGPLAALPVMEGKAALFQKFAHLNAFPICLDTQNTEEIIETVLRIAPSFGGINLEDISAPRCFTIEAELKKRLTIPVFHDDQHGTAIVVLAGIMNALRIVKKEVSDCQVVINGAGSAGIAIAKLLLAYGFSDIILCDRNGILSIEDSTLNWAQKEMAVKTNPQQKKGSLSDALCKADIFIGVSAPNIVSAEMVQQMHPDAILFAMANPTPEILPDVAKQAGARIIGTGRSDFPNQINNVLVFPGIFKGALENHATQITESMKLAAAKAIADLISEKDLHEDFIIPPVFDPRVTAAVSNAVKKEVENTK